MIFSYTRIVILKPRIVIDKPRIMVSNLTNDCYLQTWFFRFIVHLAQVNFCKPKF